jgi:hypothetical protein
MRRPLPVAVAEWEPSPLPDPLAEAIRRADVAALWHAISALPHQQRDALLMREFAGLRYDELAVALGVTEPAIESLLFRARQRLRSALAPAYAAASLPLALRDLLARVLAGAGSAGTAAKLGAATVGVATFAGGAALVAPRLDSSHGRPAPAVAGRRPARPAPVHVRRPAAPVATAVASPARPVPVVRRVARASVPEPKDDAKPDRESEPATLSDAPRGEHEPTTTRDDDPPLLELSVSADEPAEDGSGE